MTDIKETIERLEGLGRLAHVNPSMMSCDSCRGTGMMTHCAHPEECGGMRPIQDRLEWAAYANAVVQAFPTLITAFKELESERDRLKLLAADVERQNQAQGREIGQWKQELASERKIRVLRDREIARLREALERIAKSDAGECGCYYTNRTNISIAKGALKP